MVKFISNEVSNSDSYVHVFECNNDNELGTAAAMYMKNNGYNLIEGNVTNGVFEKGNKSMRLLFGAFVKYYKMQISVENGRLQVGSASSGFSGGLIGVNQVKKEAARLANGLKEL